MRADDGEHTGAMSSMSTTPASTAVIVGGGPSRGGSSAIPGLEDYTGTVLHTATWDQQSTTLDGRRVAVLGAGAEAGRIVPHLVGRARSVKVFQHSPDWILPDPNRHEPLAALLQRGPVIHTMARQTRSVLCGLVALGVTRQSVLTPLLQSFARAYLRASVTDPWLRRQLTPCFRMGGARVLISSDYYRALQQPNCKLVTWPVYAVSTNGIRTAEGIEHEVDYIILANEATPTHHPADPEAATAQ